MWLFCFVCGDEVDGVCVLYGLDHGSPIQLERGICAGCWLLFRELTPPTVIGPEQVFLSATFEESFVRPVESPYP
jgi:hypothetical protein